MSLVLINLYLFLEPLDHIFVATKKGNMLNGLHDSTIYNADLEAAYSLISSNSYLILEPLDPF